MNKLLMTLLLAVALPGVAGEVGAPYPQSAQTAITSGEANTAGTGASDGLATQSPNSMVSNEKLRELEASISGLEAQVLVELETRNEMKLANQLYFYDRSVLVSMSY